MAHFRNIRAVCTPAALARCTSAVALVASLFACGDENDSNEATTGDLGGIPATPAGGSGGAAGTGTPPPVDNGTGASGQDGTNAGGTSANGTDTGGATDTGGETAPRTTAAIVGDRRVPFSPENDREFAEFFIEHHQMAIDMANEVVDRGERPEVIALAQSVVDQQTEEIGVLRAAIAALGSGQAGPPQSPEDPHTSADMSFMQGLSGAELDEMFLLDMIPHHAAGLPVAHRAEPQLAREELQTMARNIFETQSREIGELKDLLADMNVTGAGEDRAAPSADRADFGLEGDRRVPLTPADDVEFVDFFISHHEMAIMMAEHEAENGENAEVIALAESVRAAQTEELETMRSIRNELAGSAEPSPMPADPHADPEMAEMMMATGVDLDRMFLTEMIPHHAAGLPTAHRATPHVQNEQLRTLAAEMYQAQSEEIGEMKDLLDTLE